MKQKNSYFNFLCSIVGRSEEYNLLLDELHKIEFYSLIPNDDNRWSDGLYLRNTFLDQEGEGEDDETNSLFFSTDQCTVLEMLIGVAYRLEFETSQGKWEKTVGEWFWILIDNLGLTKYTDYVYNHTPLASDSVLIIVMRMMNREYDADGNGGLFPLKNPKKDQRRIEIYYQMNAYVLENYPIIF